MDFVFDLNATETAIKKQLLTFIVARSISVYIHVFLIVETAAAQTSGAVGR